jgi:hypothetical protein
MSKTCSVPKCNNPAAGFGILCDRHKSIQRRHGHPEQTAITVQELAPYRQRVRLRMAKNASNEAWSILSQRWEKMLAGAKDTEAALRTGPHVAPERQALLELIKIGDHAPAATLSETTLAIYLMHYEQPRRFKSDAAFDAQLARRVRGLTDTNAGSYWDDRAKRTKRVYKDIPPRTLVALAGSIKAVFGVAGVFVAKLEQQEAEQQNNEKAALAAALENLK